MTLFERSSAPFLVRRRDPPLGGAQLGLNDGIERIVLEGVLVGRHGRLPVALLHQPVGKRGVRSIEGGTPGQQDRCHQQAETRSVSQARLLIKSQSKLLKNLRLYRKRKLHARVIGPAAPRLPESPSRRDKSGARRLR